eukprot:GHVS01069373.1.p1 GENE.GHVS01069373.1~~GHVS01069373.1.p1  ORF type:complete len:329 (+),score=133.81 GHVS01069373.1:174-1160(+)
MSDMYASVRHIPPVPTSVVPNTDRLALAPPREYWDKKTCRTRSEWLDKLKVSTAVYVGNLSFYTAELQIYELFSKCGYVKSVVLGLNKLKKNPCGFCFVVFSSVAGAVRACNILNKATLDGRVIRVDRDIGGEELDAQRRYGRGEHGLQWRDEFRTDFDLERGGQGGGLDYDNYQQQCMRKRARSSLDEYPVNASFLRQKAVARKSIFQGPYTFRQQPPPPPPPPPPEQQQQQQEQQQQEQQQQEQQQQQQQKEEQQQQQKEEQQQEEEAPPAADFQEEVAAAAVAPDPAVMMVTSDDDSGGGGGAVVVAEATPPPPPPPAPSSLRDC